MTDEERYEWEQGLDAFCDEYDEPIGSCDNCGTNLYADDDWDGLCGQCEWFRMQVIPAQMESE